MILVILRSAMKGSPARAALARAGVAVTKNLSEDLM
jgi:hypothetical protein